MELQSEKIGAVAGALAKAQGLFEGAKKSATNPHLNKPYADINSVLDVVRGPLSNNGLALTQPCIIIDGRQCVMTQITHGESGEWMRSYVPIFEGNQKGAQGYGSGVTYARRYGLSALLGVGAEDDDGAAVSGQNAGANRATPKADNKPYSDPKATVKKLIADIDAIDDAASCNSEAVAKAYEADWQAISEKQREWLIDRIQKRAGALSQAPAKDDADLTDVPF